MRLSALLPMAYNGVGPAATCINLMRGLTNEGLACDVYLDIARQRIRGVRHRAAAPRYAGLLPYRFMQKRTSPRTEARFLADLHADDIAYLWPSASLASHHAAKRIGAPVVLEGINTRMRFAKRILDAAYEEIGVAPAHGITEQRIVEEDEKLALADAIFCPSPGVEAAVVETPGGERKIMRASYGVALGAFPPPAPRPAADGLTVLFVGSVCVRKGAHKLLAAWVEARVKGALLLVGDIEDTIRSRCADLLAHESVRCLGFRRDVRRFYGEADVFALPSFEEGDALVTYEAAAHGLPLMVSPMGAGRMGAARPESVRLIDPWDVGSITAALQELARSVERRRALSEAARLAVQDYDWGAVARRRHVLLRERFGS
jgi:glycosyltransferase involved in cell wall biosynthesis